MWIDHTQTRTQITTQQSSAIHAKGPPVKLVFRKGTFVHKLTSTVEQCVPCLRGRCVRALCMVRICITVRAVLSVHDASLMHEATNNR